MDPRRVDGFPAAAGPVLEDSLRASVRRPVAGAGGCGSNWDDAKLDSWYGGNRTG